jgi:hypothetical protein
MHTETINADDIAVRFGEDTYHVTRDELDLAMREAGVLRAVGLSGYELVLHYETCLNDAQRSRVIVAVGGIFWDAVFAGEIDPDDDADLPF